MGHKILDFPKVMFGVTKITPGVSYDQNDQILEDF